MDSRVTRRDRSFALWGKGDRLDGRAMSRFDVLHMIKRRAEAAGLPYSTRCHTFRATGITAYLQNGGTLEHAQTIANHESPNDHTLRSHREGELVFDANKLPSDSALTYHDY